MGLQLVDVEWRYRLIRWGRLSGMGGTVRMEHFGCECHFWRLVWEIVWEF